jgi:5-methylcytosine-specific restriction endonuclease McrA
MPKYTPKTPSLSLFDGKVCACCGIWKQHADYAFTKSPNGMRFATCCSCPVGKRLAYQREFRQSQAALRPRLKPGPKPLPRLAEPPPEKRCGICGDTKASTEFYRRASSPDCLHPHCKVCAAAYTAEWKDGRKEHLAAYWERWYSQNREEVCEKAKGRYDTVTRREYGRRWRAARPDLHRAQYRRYRNRKVSAPGGHTHEEWLALKARYDYCCLRCGKHEPEIALTEDHVIPLARGGSDDIGNIQPLCKPCNSSKNAKTIDYRPDS